jgi:hypothetical protein
LHWGNSIALKQSRGCPDNLIRRNETRTSAELKRVIPEADFHAAADVMCPGPDLEWFGVDADGHVAYFFGLDGAGTGCLGAWCMRRPTNRIVADAVVKNAPTIAVVHTVA